MARVKVVFTALLSVLLGAGLPHLLLFPERAPAAELTADKVFVFKSKRILVLMKDGEVLRAYKVALGREPAGAKERAGDKRTPEGSYVLDSRNPNSRFHRALHVSYPNETDVLNARRHGVQPGGDIMIHGLSEELSGLGSLHRKQDWTDGCIAVTNAEIEEIWRLVPDGTPIEIKP